MCYDENGRLVARAERCDVQKERTQSPARLVQGFPAGKAHRVGCDLPGLQQVRPTLPYLSLRQSLPFPKIKFCQSWIVFDRIDLEPLGDDLRGLPRTVQRTGENRSDT